MSLRNIAIIAHVDHGKTTLVDAMFRQSGMVRENQRIAERTMDTGELERERGITILAKCTSVTWRNTKINIVDTPGHADFGGEVERILSMVDGAVLLVDAAEGPLPQTKFVISKALDLGLRPMVVINKVDRSDVRPSQVLDEVFDMFDALGADEHQLDFPVLYAVGRDGWAVRDLETDTGVNLNALFDLIVSHVPSPAHDTEQPFTMLATTLESDPYLGRVLTGRIATGRAKVNMPIRVLDQAGATIEEGRATKLLAFRGLERVPVDSADAGDIIAIAGFAGATVAHTLCAPEAAEPIASRPVDPPTLAMTFSVNDSPLAGREGKKVTGRQIGERLFREAEGNVAIRVLISNADGDAVAYALFNLLDHGPQFIAPGTRVYRGMIIGEHTRDNDLEVNPLKSKQLTNFRAAGKDDAIKLPPPQALAYIQDDELVEVTPENIRLRKRHLDPHQRKKLANKADAA